MDQEITSYGRILLRMKGEATSEIRDISLLALESGVHT